jgi:hypothetical protein
MRSLQTPGCHNVDTGWAPRLRQGPERPSPADTRPPRRRGPTARGLGLAARSIGRGPGPRRPKLAALRRLRARQGSARPRKHPRGARRSVRWRAWMLRRQHPAARSQVAAGTPPAQRQGWARGRGRRLGSLKLALSAGLRWPHWHGLHAEPIQGKQPAEPPELQRARVPGNAWPERPQRTRDQPCLWAAGAKTSSPCPEGRVPGRPEAPCRDPPVRELPSAVSSRSRGNT